MKDLVAEFLARGGKVTELPAGETSGFKNITTRAREHQESLTPKVGGAKDAYSRRNKERPKSGYQNIRIQKKTIAVFIGHGNHTSFPIGDDKEAALKKAIECRDKCRAAMGLPPAIY